jgi:hypothetical protein
MSSSQRAAHEHSVSSSLELMPKLLTGLDVNVRFRQYVMHACMCMHGGWRVRCGAVCRTLSSRPSCSSSICSTSLFTTDGCWTPRYPVLCLCVTLPCVVTNRVSQEEEARFAIDNQSYNQVLLHCYTVGFFRMIACLM